MYLSDQVRPSQVTTSKKPGVWHIPTPTSADVYTGNMESSQQSDDSMHSVSLPDFVNRWPTPTSPERSGTNPHTGKGEGLSKTVKMWPTPTPWQQQESIENWTERRAKVREERHNGNGFGIPLDMAARMMPTPRTRGLLGGSGSREMVQAMGIGWDHE